MMAGTAETGGAPGEGTGRLLRGVGPTARRILFSPPPPAALARELWLLTEVDRAHLVMLAEQEIVDPARAAALLDAIALLRTEEFAPLVGRPAPRGLFLAYEGWLIETLGAETGGVLHTARSRNDLNATLHRMKLRAPFMRLADQALRLQAVLLRRARRYQEAVMPAYTHGQPAVPSSYGHYLLGVATALGRDVLGLCEAAQDIERCPLGAGAVGGTSFPIEPERPAELLGFRYPVLHSVDAVASRDLALRLLSAAAVLGVTLSRLATDLLAWSGEAALVELDDTVVGSSSMMPQKRNPFLLEHVQGRAAAPLGALVSAATAMHAKPFTNHIAVGSEAVAPVTDALERVADAAVLARLAVAAARPRTGAMLARAEEGYTAATELANRLVRAGMAFRTAHHLVGTAVREALERDGEPLPVAAARVFAREGVACDVDGLEAPAVVEASAYGGGPGPFSFGACWWDVHRNWREMRDDLRGLQRRWTSAEDDLDRADRALRLAALRVDDPHAPDIYPPLHLVR
jgi:argininosuccinate lyase